MPPQKNAEQKLDDLLIFLHEHNLDAEEVCLLHQRFNDGVNELPDYKEFLRNRITHPESNDPSLVLSRQKNRLHSLPYRRKHMSNTFRVIVSLLIITLGFAMIIMPAPPYFEMFTLFYFTADDGFTLMDLISLIIIFAGIYTLITTWYKRPREE